MGGHCCNPPAPPPPPLRWPWHNALYYHYAFKMTVRKNSSVFSHSQPRTPTVTFHKWKNHRWRRLIVDNHSFWGNANSWIKFVRGYQSWSNLICSPINLCTLLWFKLRKFWFKTKFKGVITTKQILTFAPGGVLYTSRILNHNRFPTSH